MPRDYPSQAQTGTAKFLEGLFNGIVGGIDADQKERDRKAYLDALYGYKAQAASQPKTVAGKGKGGKPEALNWAALNQAFEDQLRLVLGLESGVPIDPSSMSETEAEQANKVWRQVVGPQLENRADLSLEPTDIFEKSGERDASTFKGWLGKEIVPVYKRSQGWRNKPKAVPGKKANAANF
jgi:hypothetical protein